MARVLVSTEDTNLRWELVRGVAAAGHDVVEPGGKRPDVVLVDLDGPEGRGGLASWPDLGGVPVVAVTAGGDAGAVAEAVALGAVDVLVVPLRPVELGARVRAAVRTAELEASLREALRTDLLTGLSNRRHLDEHLAMTASAARRHHQPVSLLLVDVDHLRRVNDRDGHAAGDEVLRAVGRRITAALRTEDMAGRWGGEEFLVLLPATGLDGAWHLAERIRDNVSSSPVAAGSDHDVVVTVSVGCAEGAGDDVDDHLRRCGQALEEAKAAGRNKVVLDTSAVA